MAETNDASLGYMGEMHLSSDETAGNLYELVQVKEFDVPTGGTREQVEKTHLKTPGWRRDYLSGFYEDSDFEVLLNFRPLSDTDVMLDAALNAGDVRAFKAVLPENGEPVAQIEGTCKCTGYNRGRVTADGVMEGTATFRIVTVEAIEAYAS